MARLQHNSVRVSGGKETREDFEQRETRKETLSKINMFHLTDIVTKQKDFSNKNTNSLQLTSHGETLALQEKMDAIVKMSLRSTQPGYQQAMRSLLTSGDFF